MGPPRWRLTCEGAAVLRLVTIPISSFCEKARWASTAPAWPAARGASAGFTRAQVLTGQCSANFASGTVVTLSATPLAGWSFSHWSGNQADWNDGVVT